MDKAAPTHMDKDHQAAREWQSKATAGEGSTAAATRFVDPREGVFLITLLVGLVMIALVWLFTQMLGGVLAETHLRHKAAGLSTLTAETLREAGWDGRGPLDESLRQQLRQLVRFSDAEHLVVADANGRVLFSTEEAGIAQRLAAPREQSLSLHVTTEKEGEILRRMAHVVARVPLNGRHALVAFDLDATGTLAWYRQIGLVFAKVMAVLVIAAMLLIGLLVHRRITERMQTRAELEALRRRNDEEHRRAEALQMKLVHLQEELATLNRRLAETMRQNHPGNAGGHKRQVRATHGK